MPLSLGILLAGYPHAACYDPDGDGAGSGSTCALGAPSAPTDPAVNPGASEDGKDWVDHDCDGSPPTRRAYVVGFEPMYTNDWGPPEFVTEGRNLILSGKPGRGKTHLAIAVAYKAIQNGFEARFVTASALIDDLHAAAMKGTLREATATYVQPHVLVVDEVGYLQCADDAANVLYGVVDQRCLKRRPLVFTTNKSLKAWGQVLHDPELAEALLDRVLERGQHMRLGGLSWRTRETDPAAFSDEA